jgi:homoserine dehydrogenase
MQVHIVLAIQVIRQRATLMITPNKVITAENTHKIMKNVNKNYVTARYKNLL